MRLLAPRDLNSDSAANCGLQSCKPCNERCSLLLVDFEYTHLNLGKKKGISWHRYILATVSGRSSKFYFTSYGDCFFVLPTFFSSSASGCSWMMSCVVFRRIRMILHRATEQPNFQIVFLRIYCPLCVEHSCVRYTIGLMFHWDEGMTSWNLHWSFRHLFPWIWAWGTWTAIRTI